LRRTMESTNSKYKIGDAVMVAAENPTGNPRTPHYIRGKRGVIGAVHGLLENVRDHRGIHKPLYTVRFDLSEVSTCYDQDSVWVDVHEEWLSSLQPEERN
jgi:Nitrile hydratase beta subunit, C-terminal